MGKNWSECCQIVGKGVGQLEKNIYRVEFLMQHGILQAHSHCPFQGPQVHQYPWDNKTSLINKRYYL